MPAKRVKRDDYERMYLVPIDHDEGDGPLPKGVILEAFLRTSGDTVAVLKVGLDWMEVWRHGKLVRKVQTVREAFAFVDREGW